MDLVLSNPVEIVDRAFNKIEVLLDRQPRRELQANGYPSHDEVRRHARRCWGYEAADDLEGGLNALLPERPADDGERFEAVWQELAHDLAGSGGGLDGDVRLARTVWAVVRSVRPERMIETGVSRGILTRVILEAMEYNGNGHLWSIDLPPQHVDWRDQTRAAVKEELHHRWTFLRGSSRRHLPRLLKELETIDVFLHDSQHTERNMAYEMRLALLRLRPGGVLMSDDVHENAAWRDVTLHRDTLIAQEQRKAGMFGVMRVHV